MSWKGNIWQSLNMGFMLLSQQNMALESAWLLKDPNLCMLNQTLYPVETFE